MTVMGTLIQPLPRTRIRIHVPRFTNTETLWHSRAEKQVLSAAKSKMIREAPRRPEATGNHWLPVKNVSMCNPRRDSRVATGAAKRGKKKHCQSRSLVFQATVIIFNDYQVTRSNIDPMSLQASLSARTPRRVIERLIIQARFEERDASSSR